MHVATSTIQKLVDYVVNTHEDGLSSEASVQNVVRIINKNLAQENYNGKANTKFHGYAK
jgi:4-O-beta-D-mannosyl-D-glucose phosphorylase